MDSTGNKYLFYTKEYSPLFTSLQRYFNYILKQELNLLSQIELLTSTNAILVYQEERENPDLLKIVANNSNIKIIVVGFDSNSSLNLMDFSNIKNNLSKIICSEGSQQTQVFTEIELIDKIQNFFKGHGEESIFQVLNAVVYCFQNYEFYKLGGLTDEEYKDYYVVPAKSQWDKFLIRFDKYKVYLRLLGYNVEVSEIDNYCVILDEFVKNSSELIEAKETGDENNLAKVKKNLGLIKKIDYFFTTISNKLGLMDAPIQSPGS